MKKEYSAWEEWKARSWRNRNTKIKPKNYEEANPVLTERRRKAEFRAEIRAIESDLLYS